MSTKKLLTLPEGTKVRMTCDYESFKKGDIVTRKQWKCDDAHSVRFDIDDYWEYLTDISRCCRGIRKNAGGYLWSFNY